MMAEGWVDACAADEIDEEDVIRFDRDARTFAIYRTEDDRYFATDGLMHAWARRIWRAAW